jgi:single-stranded-DNA-specific exonuclease
VATSTPWTLKHPEVGHVSRLEKALGLRRAVAACLINRNIVETEDAERFLNPRLSDLFPPEGLPDLSSAVDRIASAVIRQERIGVFGDYDVDGITSAAVVSQFLMSLKADVKVGIADRFSGYGMGPETMDGFVGAGCSLVLAVDLGTSDHEAAARAKASGIDLVVIDHHSAGSEYPDVVAFVNPKRSDCTFADPTPPAAVGLSFYVIAAVRTELIGRGFLRKEDVDLRGFLDLVALGTVADVMPLRGNNRILVHHGLKCLSENPRIGLRKLLRIAKVRSSRIRSEHIAFQLAPRLNAAGRIGNAEEAFNLLCECDLSKAETLALRLDQLSLERRRLENEVLDAARAQLSHPAMSDFPMTFVSGDGWHRGVLGIVASRLVEETGKPSFVVGFEGDEGIGSVRGRGQFNVFESLQKASDRLLRFGGHKDAAGFTVKRENLTALRTLLCEFASGVDVTCGGELLECDDSLRVSELDAELVMQLEKLGPFGAGNPEPVFDINGLYVLEQRVVGQEHLKLELKTPSGRISAFGPRMGAVAGTLPPLIRAAAHITFDEWRGNGDPELRLAAHPVEGS